MTRVIQLVPDLVFGDAVSNDCLLIDRVVQAAGFETLILVERADERYHGRVKRFDVPAGLADLPPACRPMNSRSLPPAALRPDEIRPDDVVVFHYSTWTETAAWLLQSMARPLVLVYHNVTPPQFFASANARAAELSRRAIDALPALARLTSVAIAKSTFSERELQAAGFPRTAIVPLAVELTTDQPFTKRVLEIWRRRQPVLLSVGRIAPNKRIEDAIHVLAAYRERIGDAWLLLVGAQDTAPAYRMWLGHLVSYLGLDGRVAWAGHVSREDLLAYYRAADAYLCMSEHEGFCVPLVEAMQLGVPVIAQASSAIPETLGDAGILLHSKQPAVTAEIIHRVVSDRQLRARLIERGRQRAQGFAPEQVGARFLEHLRATAAERSLQSV